MKNMIKTDFLLREVRADGSLGEPELMGIDRAAEDWTMGRRGFLGLAALGLAGREARAGETDARAPQRCPDEIIAYHGDLVDMAISPDGGRLALTTAKSEGHFYKLWELPGGRLLGRYEGEGDALFSPDGRLFIYPARDASVRLVDVASGKELAALKGHAKKPLYLAVSSDGKMLASASGSEKTVRLWSLPEGKPVKVLTRHPGELRRLIFTPDGRRLVSAGLGDTARVWNMPGGEPGAVIRGIFPGMNLGTAPDNEHLVSIDARGRAMAWSLSTGKRAPEVLKTPKRHAERCVFEQAGSAFAFGPDGKTLLVYGTVKGGHAVLRAYPGGEVLGVLETKDASVKRISFLPDSTIMALEDVYPGRISYWKLNPPGSYGSMGGLGWFRRTGATKASAERYALAPDGSFMVTGRNQHLALMSVPGGELQYCFFDINELYYDRKFRVIEEKDREGRSLVRAITEKETLPAGSVCTCNTVAGKKTYSRGGSGRRTYRICTCVPVK